MAPSTSPIKALQDLINIMNIEQNKQGSVQQIKKACAKAKDFLPEFKNGKLHTEQCQQKMKP